MKVAQIGSGLAGCEEPPVIGVVLWAVLLAIQGCFENCPLESLELATAVEIPEPLHLHKTSLVQVAVFPAKVVPRYNRSWSAPGRKWRPVLPLQGEPSNRLKNT